MSEIALALRWWLAVQLCSLAGLPLALWLFRRLPGRAYGLSKALALLLAGYLFWLLGIFGWVRNSVGGILVALGFVLAAGLLLWWRAPAGRRARLWSWLASHWRLILATELVFTLAFVAWAVVRSYMPRIETAGGEKWMEIAFLRAILRSESFPPHDPWLSGFAISYYYFGYVIVAMVTRLAALPPSIAFNLGIALLFALACAGAYALLVELLLLSRIEPERRATSSEASRAGGPGLWSLVAGLFGPLLLAVMGNLEGLMEVLFARGLLPARFWQWLDVPGLADLPRPEVTSWVPRNFMWWWHASRTLRDYTPFLTHQEVIDEFPGFSFLLGDMHPHVLALPFVLLALGLALNLYVRTAHGQRWELRLGRRTAALPLGPASLILYTLCLGGLGFLNTWDFPIYLFVVLGAYLLAAFRFAQPVDPGAGVWDRVLRLLPSVVGLALPLLLGGLLFYLPFWLGFRSQAGGLLPNVFNATRVQQFVLMFGPLLFLGAAWGVAQAVRAGVGWRAWGSALGWSLLAGLGGLMLVLVGSLVLARLGHLGEPAWGAYVTGWLQGRLSPDVSASIGRSLLNRLLNPWVSLLLLAAGVGLVLTLFAGKKESISGGQELEDKAQSLAPSPQSLVSPFVLLLLFTGVLLTLSVEWVYLRDNFGTRMNTVFKFYFQAWVLWSLASAYALVWFLRRGSIAVTAVAMSLVLAGLIYPALAIPARARETGAPPTLDGAAYLAQTNPGDYAAIRWLDANVDGAPVVLETPATGGAAYTYTGRVSAHTGLPTLLGWGGHEAQWRGSYEEQARREPDIHTLYSTPNTVQALELLDKYGITYVYVGPLERVTYPAVGLEKFDRIMDVVYDREGITIYRRRQLVGGSERMSE